MHREIATFEANTAGAPPVNNVNGPPGQETRPVPDDINVYPTFRGLPDILASPQPPPAGARGTLILDHHMYGSTVETGVVTPYQHALADLTGSPRTPPTSMHMLWHGWWDDVNGDGVIDDEWCESGLSCSAADEFVWRGANSDEKLAATAWFFPGDYDGSIGTGHRTPLLLPSVGSSEPLSALSEDCRYHHPERNPRCISPLPDMPYTDSTASAANPRNQRWAGNNGGGQWTPEEFLVVSQHVVTLVAPPALENRGRPEWFPVECGLAEGCMRDYDWYDSLATDAVEGLYLHTMACLVRPIWYSNEWNVPPFFPDTSKPPRGASACGVSVTVPPEVEPVLSAVDPIWQLCMPHFGWISHLSECHAICPRAVPVGCAPDMRRLDARRDGASAQRAYADQQFVTAVPAMLNYPSGLVLNNPEGGFYGHFATATAPLAPESSYVAGPTVGVRLEAWRWVDANGDGYIGAPSDSRVAAYEQGWADSPNDGACEATRAFWCELHPATSAYAGARIEVSMDGGWPAGSFLLRNASHAHWGELGILPDGGLEPLSGPGPAILRPEDRCRPDRSLACHTKDALLLPAGSHPTLHGTIPGGVTIRWTEGATPYAVAFEAAWMAEGLPGP